MCEQSVDVFSDLLFLDIAAAARCEVSVTVSFSSDTGEPTIATLELGYKCIVVVNHANSTGTIECTLVPPIAAILQWA